MGVKMKAADQEMDSFNYEKSLKRAENVDFGKYIIVNKFLNRPLASLLVRLIYPTRITPNQITVISFLIGCAGGGLFFLGTPAAFLWGGILVQLSSVVDCADGMLARAKDMCSRFGSYLDIFCDRINEFIVIFGYVVGLYRYSADMTYLWVGFSALSLYFLETTLYYLYLRMNRDEQNGQTSEPRALLLFLIFIFGITNTLPVGIYLLLGYTSATNIFLAVRFYRCRKIFS